MSEEIRFEVAELMKRGFCYDGRGRRVNYCLFYNELGCPRECTYARELDAKLNKKSSEGDLSRLTQSSL